MTKNPSTNDYMKKYHEVNDPFFNTYFTYENMINGEWQIVDFENCTFQKDLTLDCLCPIDEKKDCKCEVKLVKKGDKCEYIEYDHRENQFLIKFDKGENAYYLYVNCYEKEKRFKDSYEVDELLKKDLGLDKNSKRLMPHNMI